MHENDKSYWYQYISRSGKLPDIYGSQIGPSWPLIEDNCCTMMLLHKPNWRKNSEVKSCTKTWEEAFWNFPLQSHVQISSGQMIWPGSVKLKIQKWNKTENSHTLNYRWISSHQFLIMMIRTQSLFSMKVDRIVIGTLKAHLTLVYPSLLKTSLWRKSILVPLR